MSNKTTMLWLSYFIIALHTLYALLVISVPFLILSGKLIDYSTRLFIASIIVVAVISTVINGGDCPLTFLQRKIEVKLKPWKRPVGSFIQDGLAFFRINVPRNLIRFGIIFFVSLDLFLLLFWGKIRQ